MKSSRVSKLNVQ